MNHALALPASVIRGVWFQGNDQFACMQLIADKKADLMQVDPGMGYTGGQYYNLMPIMAEKYTTGMCRRR